MTTQLFFQDALTLQRIVLEKKVELVDDWSNEVPDIKGALQEMMTSNIYIINDFITGCPDTTATSTREEG